jgi:hypothetical protein
MRPRNSYFVLAHLIADEALFPDKPRGNHAAVYLGQSKDGSTIYVYDQYVGKALSRSSLPGRQDWAVVTTKQDVDPKPSDSESRLYRRSRKTGSSRLK